MSGARKPIRTEAPPRRWVSSAEGGATLTTASASQTPLAERGAGRLEVRVGDAGAGAGAGLDDHLMARRGELAHDVRDERDAALAGGRLGGDADPQGAGPYPNAS